jgi:hypothetical protein
MMKHHPVQERNSISKVLLKSEHQTCSSTAEHQERSLPEIYRSTVPEDGAPWVIIIHGENHDKALYLGGTVSCFFRKKTGLNYPQKTWHSSCWWNAKDSVRKSLRLSKPRINHHSTAWWFQSLWKIWKSVGMIIPNIWKNKKYSKPPIRNIP